MKNRIFIFSILLSLGCSQNNQFNLKPPRGYPNFTLLKWAAYLGFLDFVDLEPEIPDSIQVSRDIVYKETDQRPLKLDIYKDKFLVEPAPVIIFIHGGSWTTGGKEDYLIYCLAYAQKGYVTASLSYRFSQEAISPAAVEADPIEYHTTNGVFNFSNFWYTIAGLSILTTLFFYTSFREEPEVEANS